MPLLLERGQVLDVFAEAAARNWVIPSFGTENLTTTEAILSAAMDMGEVRGSPDLPVMVAITHRYPERSQSSAYSHTGDPVLGLRLFEADLRALTAPGGPFARLRVLVHLDHGQHELDGDVLDNPAGRFSSVMYDASSLPFDENIEATRRYVEAHGKDVLIEGACDTIAKEGDAGATGCTPPADAERFFKGTGVDWVVANLGTEHRAGVSRLNYRGDIARDISARIGKRICLHGASSVDPAHLSGLFADGIVKVNLWTGLERDSSAVLLETLVRNAAAAAGGETARTLLRQKLLGEAAGTTGGFSLDHGTTKYRQGLVFENMRKQVRDHLERFYPQ